MYRVDIYRVDPASIAHMKLVALVAIGATALLAAVLALRFGWRSWWAILLAAVAVPTLSTLLAGGAPNWPIMEYIIDVVAPLALLGLPAAVVGCVVGVAIRWFARRKPT